LGEKHKAKLNCIKEDCRKIKAMPGSYPESEIMNMGMYRTDIARNVRNEKEEKTTNALPLSFVFVFGKTNKKINLLL